MADVLKRVSAGDGKPTARQWNGLVEAANKTRRIGGEGGAGSSGPLLRDPSIVLIKNGTTAALPANSILGIDSPLILPNNDLDQFRARVMFKGVTPDSSHVGKFVVTLQALAPGDIGRAVIDGACQVQVNFNDAADASADIKEGVTDYLDSGSGSAQVIWKPAGTGLLWATVILQAGGGGDDRVVYCLQTAGTGGTVSTRADFTYKIYDKDDHSNEIATEVPVYFPRPIGPMEVPGIPNGVAPAGQGYGIATQIGGAWVLIVAPEVIKSMNCPT